MDTIQAPIAITTTANNTCITISTMENRRERRENPPIATNTNGAIMTKKLLSLYKHVYPIRSHRPRGISRQTVISPVQQNQGTRMAHINKTHMDVASQPGD